MSAKEIILDPPNYIATLWPSKDIQNRAKRSLIVIFSISAVACIVGILFWNDDHTYTATRFSLRRGEETVTSGWPVYMAMWGGIIAGLMVISGLVWYFSLDTKTPAMAVEQDGLYINCGQIKKTMVPWNQISDIETVDRSVTFQFANPQEIIRKQSSKSRRTQLDYTLKKGNLTIYAVDFDGDFNDFKEKLTRTFNSTSHQV